MKEQRGDSTVYTKGELLAAEDFQKRKSDEARADSNSNFPERRKDPMAEMEAYYKTPEGIKAKADLEAKYKADIEAFYKTPEGIKYKEAEEAYSKTPEGIKAKEAADEALKSMPSGGLYGYPYGGGGMYGWPSTDEKATPDKGAIPEF